MSKSKEKNSEKKILEDVVFDDYEYAKKLVDELEKNKTLHFVALAIAGFVSLLSFIWIGDTNNSILLFIIIVGSAASYFLGGGFGTAINLAFKIAKFGWFVVPFPFDIISGLVCLGIAIFGFFLFPIIFVGLNYIQNSKNLKAAQEYLSCYKKR